MRRHVFLGLALAACALLVAGEFSDLNEIRIGGVTRPGQGVGDNHGYALLVIAIMAAVMAFGAWMTRTRPAAIAVAVLGAAAVLIVLAVDGPDTDAVGVIGENYEDVSARAASGFKLVAAGAVLLLFSGILTAAGAPGPSPSTRRERPARS